MQCGGIGLQSKDVLNILNIIKSDQFYSVSIFVDLNNFIVFNHKFYHRILNSPLRKMYQSELLRKSGKFS